MTSASFTCVGSHLFDALIIHNIRFPEFSRWEDKSADEPYQSHVCKLLGFVNVFAVGKPAGVYPGGWELEQPQSEGDRGLIRAQYNSLTLRISEVHFPINLYSNTLLCDTPDELFQVIWKYLISKYQKIIYST